MNLYDMVARGQSPNLPEQINSTVVLLDRIARSLDSLNAALVAHADVAPDGVDVSGKWVSIPSVRPFFSTAEGTSIVGLILSVDTAGLYHLGIGNDPIYLNFQLAIGATFIPLDGERRIMLPPGVDLSFTADTGNPKMQASACLVARPQPGRKVG